MEEEEQLGSLGGEANPDRAQLGRYIEVLQARQNEMPARRNKQIFRNWLPIRHPSDECFLGRKDILCTQGLSPSLETLPAAPALSGPAAIPQFKYAAPVESNVDAAAVITEFYLRGCIFQSKSYWLSLPRLGGTSRRRRLRRDYLALPVEAMAAHTV